MTSRMEVEEARRRTDDTIALIRSEIERRAGITPSVDRAGMERSLADARQRANVNAHWGIAPSWPMLGRVEVLTKRVMRILLRWYINPIVEQQNEFNLSVLGVLYELEAQLQVIISDMQHYEEDTDQGTSI
ncbi:hypothetical protein BH23CHL2_BH23CHL2_15070 [soil metagenome]